MQLTLPQIQAALPPGFSAIKYPGGYLAVYYPPNLTTLQALALIRDAGAEGYNVHYSGPCHAFPNHAV